MLVVELNGPYLYPERKCNISNDVIMKFNKYMYVNLVKKKY